MLCKCSSDYATLSMAVYHIIVHRQFQVSQHINCMLCYAVVLIIKCVRHTC